MGNNGPRIKFALVGYGLNALGHRLEMSLSPPLRGNFEWIAAFDPNPATTEKLKKNQKIKTASSFEDLLDTPNLDAVVICSPPQFHADQAVAALESGHHVLSEVPMAIKEADLERIISAEDKSNKTYQLGENYCFFSEVLFAANMVSSGKYGPAVYAESEYLHDVTYRWRQGKSGDVNTPRVDAFYQLFDPLMYAHSIGPAQFAMGGIDSPTPFTQVSSYANDIGGYNGDPICKPSKAFQVALFQTETEAIAKCANAYIYSRNPMRITLQLTCRTATYECYKIGGKSYLYEANGHKVNKLRQRIVKKKKIGKLKKRHVSPLRIGGHHGSDIRMTEDWLSAIRNGGKTKINAKIGANMCVAGIIASKSARENGRAMNIKSYSD
jgi:predicted dehydrogenase